MISERRPEETETERVGSLKLTAETRETTDRNQKTTGADEVRVTVVCPTYNHSKYIRRALDGFVSQKTNFKFEVLIGDDASTDDTPDIIREYAARYPDIIRPVLREKNLGSAQNFQDLIKDIDTEYVALCEGDDYWTDNRKLQKQYDFLEANKKFAICYHPVLVKYENADVPDDVNPSENRGSIFAPHPLASPYERHVQTIKDLAVRSSIPTCSVMYRWRFRKGKDLEYFRTDVNPRDILNNLLHAETGDVFFMKDIMACYFRPNESMWSQKSLFASNALELVKFYEYVEEHFAKDVSQLLAEEKNVALPTIIKSLLKSGQLDKLQEIHQNHRKSYDIAMFHLGLGIETVNQGLLGFIAKKRRDLKYVGAALLLSLIGNILLLLLR